MYWRVPIKIKSSLKWNIHVKITIKNNGSDPNSFTSKRLRTGVDSCQTFGRSKVGDLQDSTVGVDQYIVPLKQEHSYQNNHCYFRKGNDYLPFVSTHLNVSVDYLMVVKVLEPLEDLFGVEDDSGFVVFQRTPLGAQERWQTAYMQNMKRIIWDCSFLRWVSPAPSVYHWKIQLFCVCCASQLFPWQHLTKSNRAMDWVCAHISDKILFVWPISGLPEEICQWWAKSVFWISPFMKQATSACYTIMQLHNHTQ